MDMKIYDITISDLTDGIQCVSIVQEPAMETDLLYFNKQDKKFNFSIQSEHCIMGVLIKADTPIYRYDEQMGEYYVNFTKDVIKELAEKYVSDNLLNAVSLHHNGKLIEGIQLRELFIKDSNKGINPSNFEDVPEGSLFAVFHITDTELWETVQRLGGFSIELLSEIKLQEYSEAKDELELLIDDILNEFDKKKVFSIDKDRIEDIIADKKQVNITIDAETIENQQIWGTGKDIKGDVAIVYNPKKDTWNVYELDRIKVIKLTDTDIVDWNFNAQWKMIINNMNIIIDRVLPTAGKKENTVRYAIENNMYTMIAYNDETEDAEVGFRNCWVSSWGFTVKGNECIRVWEFSGATKSGFQEGHWRLLLTRRITDFKVVDYVDAIKTALPLYNGEAKAGSGINGTMSSVIMKSTL
jgi:hypothetical protein